MTTSDTTMTDRVVALSTTFLPLDQARRVLLPPVRVARTGAVAVARTMRHWELALDGRAPTGEDDVDLARFTSESPAAAARSRSDVSEPTGADLGTADLPVADWPELSYADAQSRLGACDRDELQRLLDYERTHGHRPQYTLLLEQRLARP